MGANGGKGRGIQRYGGVTQEDMKDLALQRSRCLIGMRRVEARV